jgi:hypothetical protein
VQHIKTILAINGKAAVVVPDNWLRDKTLEDSAGLPDPDVLATEIVQDLQAALAQFAAIAEDLGVEQELDETLTP